MFHLTRLTKKKEKKTSTWYQTTKIPTRPPLKHTAATSLPEGERAVDGERELIQHKHTKRTYLAGTNHGYTHILALR